MSTLGLKKKLTVSKTVAIKREQLVVFSRNPRLTHSRHVLDVSKARLTKAERAHLIQCGLVNKLVGLILAIYCDTFLHIVTNALRRLLAQPKKNTSAMVKLAQKRILFEEETLFDTTSRVETVEHTYSKVRKQSFHEKN